MQNWTFFADMYSPEKVRSSGLTYCTNRFFTAGRLIVGFFGSSERYSC